MGSLRSGAKVPTGHGTVFVVWPGARSLFARHQYEDSSTAGGNGAGLRVRATLMKRHPQPAPQWTPVNASEHTRALAPSGRRGVHTGVTCQGGKACSRPLPYRRLRDDVGSPCAWRRSGRYSVHTPDAYAGALTPPCGQCPPVSFEHSSDLAQARRAPNRSVTRVGRSHA
jgi:hypothetical protein